MHAKKQRKRTATRIKERKKNLRENWRTSQITLGDWRIQICVWYDAINLHDSRLYWLLFQLEIYIIFFCVCFQATLYILSLLLLFLLKHDIRAFFRQTGITFFVRDFLARSSLRAYSSEEKKQCHWKKSNKNQHKCSNIYDNLPKNRTDTVKMSVTKFVHIFLLIVNK